MLLIITSFALRHIHASSSWLVTPSC